MKNNCDVSGDFPKCNGENPSEGCNFNDSDESYRDCPYCYGNRCTRLEAIRAAIEAEKTADTQQKEDENET